jgi:hypothetical protein
MPPPESSAGGDTTHVSDPPSPPTNADSVGFYVSSKPAGLAEGGRAISPLPATATPAKNRPAAGRLALYAYTLDMYDVYIYIYNISGTASSRHNLSSFAGRAWAQGRYPNALHRKVASIAQKQSQDSVSPCIFGACGS